ncbi:MAG: orotate phosphoribosyltransferase [Chloroflexi bacterium]|nr:orotate phosphoribosyltransferase [Chloroflexota bacterium]
MDGAKGMRERLLELIKEKAFRTGVFRLSSGKLSPYYIDCRKVALDAEGAYLIGRLLFEELRGSGVKAVGGLTLGADPIVTAIAVASYEAGEPVAAYIVRKEPKGHGTGQWIEGPDLASGTPVAVADDVMTTGGSLVRAIERSEEGGLRVTRVLAVVDRLEGGREELERKGYKVTSLYTIGDLGISPAELVEFQRRVEAGLVKAP